MNWVTWENIGVDRMACIWLIQKYIDLEAEFFFVPAGSKAFPKGAKPFDIPGVHYSHHRGHCTFHTFLKEHKLTDPVLTRMASIVDEADIVQEIAVEPAASGLDLLCRGVRRISRNDDEALRHGMLIYDALFAELSAETQ